LSKAVKKAAATCKNNSSNNIDKDNGKLLGVYGNISKPICGYKGIQLKKGKLLSIK